MRPTASIVRGNWNPKSACALRQHCNPQRRQGTIADAFFAKRRAIMPRLTVDGVGEFEIPQGKRLVLALEDEARIDQLHACGGNARCTTWRVEFVQGGPESMRVAEKSIPAARGLT